MDVDGSYGVTMGWKPSARRAKRTCSQCSWPFVSRFTVIDTSPMLIDPPTRVWSRPVTFASFSAMIRRPSAIAETGAEENADLRTKN